MPSKSSAKKRKNKKVALTSNSNKASNPAFDQGEDSDDLSEMPPLENLDDFPAASIPAAHQSTFAAAFPHASQQELLATANELYKQIEQAAAAALASGPPQSAGGNGAFPVSRDANAAESDDAYWLSLPAHLRSFIKNALPLAAGLAPPSTNGNPPPGNAVNTAAAAHALNLSPEQMHQAAQQLAQVVQSTGWASLGMNAPQNARHSTTTSAADRATTTTTTIPLGSFTLPLPLPTHPDHVPTNADYPADPDFGRRDLPNPFSRQNLRTASANGQAGNNPVISTATNKGKAAVSSNAASVQPQQAQAQTKPPAQVQQTATKKSPAVPTRSAVPVVPQLTANKDIKKTAGNPTKAAVTPNSQQNATNPNAAQQPAAVRPANSAAQAATIRERVAAAQQAQLAAQAQSQQHASSSNPNTAKQSVNPEREKIRDFWLALSETDRRALVKVEKEAVLRKMKDQQRHGCSCAVCGRKRSAIEEELEVLYDAYYEELEQYAHHQQRYASSGGTIPPPPGPGPFPGSIDLAVPSASIEAAKLAAAKKTAAAKALPPSKASAGTKGHSPGCPHHPHHHTHTHNGRKCNGHHPTTNSVTSAAANNKGPNYIEDEEDDEDEDEDYDDEEEEEDENDEEDEDEEDDDDPSDAYEDEEFDEGEEMINSAPLKSQSQAQLSKTNQTVRGTIASNASRLKPSSDVFGGANSLAVKNGGILTVADDLLKNDGQKFLEMMESLADKRIQRERDAIEMIDSEEEEEDEDDEEYDDEEDEEDDEEEEDDDDDEASYTDEQRMEEGRRMFQIFAARMFEQRVLQAYREKVAQERQAQLLKELEAEDVAAAEKDAKKAKDAQKKKDKKKAQKEKQEAEKLRRETEKKNQEEAAAAAAIAKAKADQERAAKQIKAEEDRRKAKELEAQKRDLEKQARLKKLEEEAAERDRLKREREEKAAREKEQKAKEKEERDRKAKEEAARREALKAEREAKEAKEAAARREEEERQEAERVKTAAAANLASSSRATQARGVSGVKVVPGSSAGKPLLPNNSRTVQSPPVNVPRPLSGIRPGPPPMIAKPTTPSALPNMVMKGMPPTGIPSPHNVQSPRPPVTPAGRGMPNIPPPPGSMLPMFGQPMSGPPFHQQIPVQMQPQQQGRPTIQSPQGGFGAIGVGPPPGILRPPVNGLHGSPFLQSPSPPGINNMLASPIMQQPQANGISPIGRSASSSENNPLSALNANSQPASGRSVSGDSGAIGSGNQNANVKPIGRPRLSDSQSEDDPLTATSSASASLRTPTPPPTLGSAALLEDLDDMTDEKMSASAAVTSPGFQSQSSFGSASWAGADGIWGASSANANPWGESAGHASKPQELERSDIIRARSGIACLHLNDQFGRLHHSALDVYRILLATYPDSSTVDLQELIASCAMPANSVNGGGRFTITQEGAGVLLSFDPSYNGRF